MSISVHHVCSFTSFYAHNLLGCTYCLTLVQWNILTHYRISILFFSFSSHRPVVVDVFATKNIHSRGLKENKKTIFVTTESAKVHIMATWVRKMCNIFVYFFSHLLAIDFTLLYFVVCINNWKKRAYALHW